MTLETTKENGAIEAKADLQNEGSADFIIPPPEICAADRLVRINSIVGKDGMLPISKSQWWKGCREGIYPKSISLGKNITCWKQSDLNRLIECGIEADAVLNHGGANE